MMAKPTAFGNRSWGKAGAVLLVQLDSVFSWTDDRVEGLVCSIRRPKQRESADCQREFNFRRKNFIAWASPSGGSF
jgi:hypothetical protein